MRRVLLLHRRPQLAQKTQNATLRGATLQMPLLSIHLHPVDDLQSAPEDEARRGGYVQHPVPVRGVRVQDCEGEHLPDPRGRPQRGARQRQGGKGTKRMAKRRSQRGDRQERARGLNIVEDAKYVYLFHRVTPELKYITANWYLNNGGEG